MSDRVDVAIVGAGPYGLSLAAHLRAAGVEHRVFGHPMAPWRTGMPSGMLLKSHGWSSNIYDPERSFTLGRFCAGRGLSYHDSLIPVPVETFIAYGEEFQRRFAPNVEEKTLVRLERRAEGFVALFDDGAETLAARVVLAVGVHPFKHAPAALRRLPPELASHSGDYGPLDGFSGKSVVVLGAGASATDIAGMLLDHGAEPTLVARTDALRFAPRPSGQAPLWRRTARRIRAGLAPNSGIGSGWPLKIYADAPWLVHALPARRRHAILGTTLGPLGSASTRERVVGRLPTLLGRTVVSAAERGGRVHLTLAQGEERRETIATDHVIAGTGYRIDLSRLTFLDPRLAGEVRTENGKPALSLAFETSVPGLHVIGPASAFSFGPVCRFVYGAVHPARAITRAIEKGRIVGKAHSGSLREARAASQ